MARTKGNQRHSGISMNEPFEAPHAQQDTPHMQQMQIVSPLQDSTPSSHVLLIIAPRFLNRLKKKGETTIVDEISFSIDGVMSHYPVIQKTIKIVSPLQDSTPSSHVLLIIAPRFLNRLKKKGETTIVDEISLSIDGVMSDYPVIQKTIKFHIFEQFTKLTEPYVPKWLMEFYYAYVKALP
ncbi:hypothetical protein KY284_007860 [Solanum tuberosum]|nr:hypothetical protein KY284_007860 [Solanum tuberosum]